MSCFFQVVHVGRDDVVYLILILILRKLVKSCFEVVYCQPQTYCNPTFFFKREGFLIQDFVHNSAELLFVRFLITCCMYRSETAVKFRHYLLYLYLLLFAFALIGDSETVIKGVQGFPHISGYFIIGFYFSQKLRDIYDKGLSHIFFGTE